MIDWNRVTELRNEVGADAFEEVISLFIEEVDDMIGQLRTMTDRAKLMDDLHFLKGSALNLGFADLAQLCASDERIAKTKDPAQVDLGALIACYEKSRAEFTAEINVQAG